MLALAVEQHYRKQLERFYELLNDLRRAVGTRRLKDCSGRWARLIHAALKTIENVVTQDSDEMAAAEVLRVAFEDADDLHGAVLEAKEVADQPATA